MTRREQDLLSAASITTFRLNGQFLALAEELARPAGLTAAWWQVLGAVLGKPLPVAGIAREMGLARQSVQRIADILVERGLAEYRDNPAHRRAKLLAPTGEGRAAIGRIGPGHAAAARRLAAFLGEETLADVVATLRALSEALDEVQAGTGVETTTGVETEVQLSGADVEAITLPNRNERTGPDPDNFDRI